MGLKINMSIERFFGHIVCIHSEMLCFYRIPLKSSIPYQGMTERGK
jgi:hypothetical protein